MTNELKRCPFCGNEAKVKCVGKGKNRTELGVKVECTYCECGTAVIYPVAFMGFEARKDLAIRNWNRRVDE